MFGPVGGSEFLLIAALALLLFGPRKLPQIGKSIGRALAEFRGATQEFKSTLQREVDLEELRETRSDLTSAGRELQKSVSEATHLGRPREPLDTAAVERSDREPPASTEARERETDPGDGQDRRS
jgi:sec-independent protein translocase protein TatA